MISGAALTFCRDEIAANDKVEKIVGRGETSSTSKSPLYGSNDKEGKVKSSIFQGEIIISHSDGRKQNNYILSTVMVFVECAMRLLEP